MIGWSGSPANELPIVPMTLRQQMSYSPTPLDTVLIALIMWLIIIILIQAALSNEGIPMPRTS
jgi:hypothetical protein